VTVELVGIKLGGGVETMSEGVDDGVIDGVELCVEDGLELGEVLQEDPKSVTTFVIGISLVPVAGTVRTVVFPVQ